MLADANLKPYLIDHDWIQATYAIVVFGLCDSDNKEA